MHGRLPSQDSTRTVKHSKCMAGRALGSVVLQIIVTFGIGNIIRIENIIRILAARDGGWVECVICWGDFPKKSLKG